MPVFGAQVYCAMLNVQELKELIDLCAQPFSKKEKAGFINRILSLQGFYSLAEDSKSGCKILCETGTRPAHSHEIMTTKRLISFGYNVLFAPKGLFTREQKCFDIYLAKEHILLRADLKAIFSKNPMTIANRIKDGSEQSSIIVLEVCSDLETSILIDGLRSGACKNKLLKEIMLLYKGRLIRLQKSQIECSAIFKLIRI
jgi:hypothetical protein